MSSLWTPSGEHPVDRPGGRAAGPTEETASPPGGPPGDEALTPEEQAAAEEYGRQLDAAREQLLQLPAGVVVGQQALQFYELAALHLSEPQPRLDDARTAIDALSAVVGGLGARLGEAEVPLRQALNQIQLAFVEIARDAPAPDDAAGPAADASEPAGDTAGQDDDPVGPGPDAPSDA
jgi:hypothetical protein